jgi:hypothetical protein
MYIAILTQIAVKICPRNSLAQTYIRNTNEVTSPPRPQQTGKKKGLLKFTIGL